MYVLRVQQFSARNNAAVNAVVADASSLGVPTVRARVAVQAFRREDRGGGDAIALRSRGVVLRVCMQS